MSSGERVQDTFAEREAINWSYFHDIKYILDERRVQITLIYNDVGDVDLSTIDLDVARVTVHATVAGTPIDEPGKRRLPVLILAKDLMFNGIKRESMSPEEFRELLSLFSVNEPNLVDGEADNEDDDSNNGGLALIDEGLTYAASRVPIAGFEPTFEEVLFGSMQGLLFRVQFHESDIKEV